MNPYVRLEVFTAVTMKEASTFILEDKKKSASEPA
jgi:hypothetical protein